MSGGNVMIKATFRTIFAAALTSALALPACLVEAVKVGGESGGGGAGGTADPADPVWGCVGDGGPLSDPPVIVASLTLLDPFSRLPRRDVAVRECAVFDLACANPITDSVLVD